jgi:hypothetical protein
MKNLAIAILAVPVLLMLSAFLTMVLSKSGIRGKISNKEEKSLRKEAEKLRIDADTRRVKKFGFVWILPSALTILRFLNFKQFLLTCLKKPTVHRFNAQVTNKIVLFAIYEKEVVRDDVRNALKELHDLDCTIVLVNSRRLTEVSRNEIAQLVSVYIERPNYGRDFGSYKDGFLWIAENMSKDFANLERFLMLNDSVFFSKVHLKNFLSKLLDSPAPVFGATMNYQNTAHIGSFCISLSSPIVQNKEFQKFWNRYRKTDLRAHTIKYGELAFSKMLAKVSPSEPPLEVLFTGHTVARLIMNNDELLRVVSNSSRVSNRAGAAIRNNLRVEMMRMDHHIDFYGSETTIELSNSDHRFSFATTFEDGFEAFRRGVSGNEKNLFDIYKQSVAATIANEFEKGSQIHRNATILPYLGCAIIKLDLEFRGITDSYDRITICNAIDPDEAEELARLLSSRPWGEENLTGWRLSAFQWGHL